MKKCLPLYSVAACFLLCLALLGAGCNGTDNFLIDGDTDLEGDGGGGSDGGDGGDGSVGECVDVTLSTAFTAIALAFGIGPTLVDDIPNQVIFKSIFESIHAKEGDEECPDGEVPDAEGSFFSATIPGETGECISKVDQTEIGVVTEQFDFTLDCDEFGVPQTVPLVTMDGLLGFTLIRILPILGGAHLEFHMGSEDLIIDCIDGPCPVNINFHVIVEFIGPKMFIWIDGCMTVCEDIFTVFGLAEIELEPVEE